MKKLIKSILALSFVFVLSSVVLCAQENTELKEVPEVTVEFTDYGFIITSSDQEYLNSITSIRMDCTYPGKENDATFESSQWIVSEGELFLPCSAYIEAGLNREVSQRITVSADGYSNYVDNEILRRWNRFSILNLTINQKNDIVITSDDETWMRMLVETPKENVISFYINQGLKCRLDNTDLLYENGQVLIPYEVQLKKGIQPGWTYCINSDNIGDYYIYADLGELTITHGRTDQKYEELISPPEYTAKFADYGLSITSEDEEFLSAIDQIMIYEVKNIKLATISSESITNDENGRFVLSGEYLSHGLEISQFYYIVVSAKGYFDSLKNDYLSASKAKNVEITMNESGDIIVTSSDLYWLKVIAETKNEDAIDVNIENSYYKCSISNEDVIYEGTQIRILPEVQRKYGLLTNESYLLSTGSYTKGYTSNQKWGTVVITHGVVKQVPSDVSIKQNASGQIEIASSDQQWLQEILLAKKDSKRSSLTVYKKSEDTIEFYNDENQIDLVYENGKILIDFETIKERGLLPGDYRCAISSAYSVTIYDDLTIKLYPNPTDIQIKVDSTSGDIIITSSDLLWLQSLVELRDEYAAIYVTTDSKDTYFWNTDENADLVMDENRVMITKEAQRKRGLVQGERVQFQFYSDVYGYSDVYEVTVGEGGYKKYPNDIQVIVEANGNIVVKSSDLDWLKSLTELHDDEYATVYVTTDSGNTWFWNDSNETDLYFEGNRVVIKPEAQRRRGLFQNEMIQLYFFSNEYGPTDYYQIQVGTGGLKEVPDDIQIIVESNGDIVIKSSDLNWLKSLTELHDDYAAVYITTETGNTWFWNDSDETDLYFEENRVVIKPEAQQRRGLYQNEMIQLCFYSNEYGPTDVFQIQIGIGGIKKVPDDLKVIQDLSWNVLILTEDLQYLESLLNGTVRFLSEELGVWWHFNKEYMKEVSGILISVEALKENGLINGEYTVELNAVDYPTATLNIQLTNLKERSPDQVNIVFDENIGILISCQNSEYIQSITSVEIGAVNSHYGYKYDDTQGIREEFRYVIPIEEMIKDGVNSNTYSIFVNSELYGLEMVTLELNSELFSVNDIVRIKGQTRFETSLKIADTLKETLGIEQFDVVILANGRDFADALAGSVLAISQKAPILMVDSKNNNMDQIMNYLSVNLKPDGKIYILGGEAAVPAWAEETLNNAGIACERIKGKNRYGTNLAILEKAEVNSEMILVCNGKSFADSLSASATGLPMLLVGSSLNDEQKAYLQKNSGKHYVILGGTGAVNTEVEEALKSYGTVERVYGKTRYETSIEIAKRFFSDSNKAVLAYAKNYPDGLCGGPLAYYMNAPLILTATGNYSTAQNYLNEKIVQRGAVLGGATLISDETVRELLLKLPVVK